MPMFDENEGHGKTLTLPAPPFWGVTFRQPAPPPDPPPAPDPALPAKLAGIARARALADQVVAQLDAVTLRAAQDAAAARHVAHQALQDAQQELAGLPVDVSADVPTEAAEDLVLRRLTLERRLPALEVRARAAADRLWLRIQETRARLDSLGAYPGGAIRVARATLRDLDEEIARLQQQRADIEIAVLDARGLLKTWGSDGYHPLR